MYGSIRSYPLDIRVVSEGEGKKKKKKKIIRSDQRRLALQPNDRVSIYRGVSLGCKFDSRYFEPVYIHEHGHETNRKFGQRAVDWPR